jgi:hypothetical protein
MAFTPNDDERVIHEYDDAQGTHVRVTVRTGRHDWNDPESYPDGGDPAVQVAVWRGTSYDAISSSITPYEYIDDIVRAAVARAD